MKFFVAVPLMVVAAAMAQSVPPAAIDAAARTITTNNFLVAWNTGVDTEAITTLEWKGGSNLTGTLGLDSCGGVGLSGNVVYFGNSLAPPDPQSGGLVLVGGGTVTPPGATPWFGQILPSGTAQVTINSNSTNCPPSSSGINVQTTYRFFNPQNSNTNWFQVQRVYDFTSAAFAHDFRPYLARLNLSSGYTEVLYPTPTGALAVMNVSNCPFGCTGPVSAPGASALSPIWDARQGWFAMHNPATLEGVVVSRVRSTIPRGGEIAAQLWVDNDAGPPDSNASSVLLLSPPAGFSGGLVTEVETLCFYDAGIWTPSLIPPLGCRIDHIVLAPWTLTFAGQTVGGSSAPQTATVTNAGPGPVKIASITAGGDFTQTNDCPGTLAARSACTITVTFTPQASGIRSGSVTLLDLLRSSPQVLSLAGLGLAAQ